MSPPTWLDDRGPARGAKTDCAHGRGARGDAEEEPMMGCRLVSLVLLALAVSACARPAPDRQWYKPTAPYTQADFDRDDYQCRRENLVTSYSSTRVLGTVHTIPDTDVDQDMYARCMNARGWQSR